MTSDKSRAARNGVHMGFYPLLKLGLTFDIIKTYYVPVKAKHEHDMNKDKKSDLHCKIKKGLKQSLIEDAALNNRDMTGQLTHILENRYNNQNKESTK